jgi:hypothetical protein
MKWLLVGARLFPFIMAAVHGVETLVTAKSGPEKQSAAVQMVRVMATAVDASVDTTVLDDPDVEKATRAAIDAYVALQNAIARSNAGAASL